MNRNTPIVVAGIAAALIAAALAGCKTDAPKPEDVRPVRAQRIAASPAAEETTYAGEVRPRYETRLAFRAPGRIAARYVELGSHVRRGQLIAQIDNRDLQLSVDALRAALASAQSESDLAARDFKRFEELRAKNFISQADFDRRATTLATSRARLDQAQAQFAQSEVQSRYASLFADTAGVVTAVEAEAGQVVSTGQTIVRVARLEELEIVISVPEHRVDELRRAHAIAVRLWAHPGKAYAGRIREIAPSTDPTTRTYIARVSVLERDAAMGLGMSATVTTYSAAATQALRVPLSALYQQDDAAAVWVVDPGSRTVGLRPVRVARHTGNDAQIAAGLAPGDLVVTAGVHLLRAGQTVRVIEE